MKADVRWLIIVMLALAGSPAVAQSGTAAFTLTVPRAQFVPGPTPTQGQAQMDCLPVLLQSYRGQPLILSAAFPLLGEASAGLMKPGGCTGSAAAAPSLRLDAYDVVNAGLLFPRQALEAQRTKGASGLLVVSAAVGTTPAGKQATTLTLQQPPAYANFVRNMLLLALALAALVMVWPLWVLRTKLSEDMPRAEWDPKESWAANVGFLSSAAVTLWALVGDVGLLKNVMLVLGLVFLVVNAMAPLINRALLTRDPGDKGGHGPVWGYLLASFITLASAYGGALTTATLANRITGLQETQVSWLGDMLIGLLVVLFVLSAWYAAVKMVQNAHLPVNPPGAVAVPVVPPPPGPPPAAAPKMVPPRFL